MRPPYDITPTILRLVTEIASKTGEAKALYMDRPSPQLRKRNKIKTIHSSLSIEGNTLTEEQITAILENKRVIGPKEDILEVKNAIQVYDTIGEFKPTSKKSLLAAHKMLMTGLIEKPGCFRTGNVGIVQGSKIAHLAPPAEKLDYLMDQLFDYLINTDDLPIIKSCVFHYELEFIHPFFDGNGRMGRLWQSVLLLNENRIFEYLPFETLISKTQSEYYEVLSKCDKSGKSTLFIEYILKLIDEALTDLLNYSVEPLSQDDRLSYFISLGINEFTRKKYMETFKTISTATASRDLKMGVKNGLFIKRGDKINTLYTLNKKQKPEEIK
jgi:Fic family protein